MDPFIFSRAKNEQEAVRMVHADAQAMYIGGGTNMLDLMKLHIERPKVVADINALPMYDIRPADGGLLIGALARNSDVAYHPLVRERYPVLSQAILSGASAQIRNMATAGGNLMQRTRCPYFYDTAAACNKRAPGTGCAALKGYNRSHAILGGSDKCVATHPSDMCVALAALRATIYVQGAGGARAIPMGEFHLLPGTEPDKETSLKHAELITAIYIPDTPFATRSAYLKVRDRASYEFALASAAVAIDVQGGIIKEARIAMGGIGTRPWRMKRAEEALQGAAAGTQAYRMAADAALSNARPLQHNAFKTELARRTLIQALQTAASI